SAAVLTWAIKESEKKPRTLTTLATGLSEVARRINPGERAAALTPAIQSLARVITETEDAGDLMGLAVPVSWLAGVVEGKAFDGEIKAILTSLTRAMKAKKNRDHLGNLVLALDSFYVNVPMLEGYDKALGTAVCAF